MGDDQTLDPATFDRWITPSDALAIFAGRRVGPSLTAIAHRIQDGIIQTAARRYIEPGRPAPFEYWKLDKSFWRDWAFKADTSFWEQGDSEAIRGRWAFRAYEIRLDPEGLFSEFRTQIETAAPEWLLVKFLPLTFDLLMDRDPPNVGEGPARLPVTVSKPAKPERVGQRELAEWAKAYLADRPGLVHAQIAEAAAAHFRGRRVTRQPLRDAIKSASYPVKPGNPLTRRK